MEGATGKGLKSQLMVNWATTHKNDTWGLPQRKYYHPAFSLLPIALFRNFSLLMNYCSVVWKTCIREKEPLVPIIPVVFYHGRKRFNLPTQFSDYFDVDDVIRDYLVDFSIVLFDTNRHKDEDILRATGNLYLTASLLAMKHIFRDIESLKPIFRRII